MFKMKVHSEAFVETMRKVSIGIPVSGQKGESDGVKIVFYKSIKGMPDMSKGIFLAFDGKVQAVSSMDISNVTADVEEYISAGRRRLLPQMRMQRWIWPWKSRLIRM